MSARGFGSVLSAGAVVGAALGFYLVSLRVASERAALEEVETRIALTQRDIRLLQTEIGTRGRLAQLERWNVRFIRLSAPSADQFVEGGFQLASLAAPPRRPAIDAPVVLAAAQIPPAGGEQQLNDQPATAGTLSRPAGEMLHVASYSMPQKAAVPVQTVPAKPVTAKAGLLPAKTPAAQTPAMKPVKTATADPLAPLPVSGARAKGSAPTASAGGGNPQRKLKDSDD